MRNYECIICTNDFRVKDAEKFREFMRKVYGADGFLELSEKKDSDGNAIFSFRCQGVFLGCKNSPEETPVMLDSFARGRLIKGLEELVAENDAIIIIRSGITEKMGGMEGVISTATIITSRGSKYMDVRHFAELTVASIIKNASWRTTWNSFID